MSQFPANKPTDAPPCWGRQYEENSRECNGCAFNFSCKNAYAQAVGRPQLASIPMYPQAPYVPPQFPTPQTYQSPYTSSYSPPPPPAPYQSPYQNWAAPQAPQYSGAGVTRGHNPMYAPPPPGYVQQQQPAPLQDTQFRQMFGQYPEETTGERLGKNVILRMLEAVFTELSRFFHYWPWPKLGQ